MPAQQIVLYIKYLVLSVISVLLLTTYHLLLTTPAAFAQTNVTSPSVPPSSNFQPLPLNIPPQSPIYANLQLNNLAHGLSCFLAGLSAIGQPCIEYQLQKDLQGKIQTIPVLSSVNLSGGVLGSATSLLGLLFENQPLVTTDYLTDLSQSFGFVKEASAQVGGSGEKVLNPILALWQVSRNFAYLFMIIIFMLVGLMVMFRNKINPQTVITVQAALPGLIIGLVLITFSYFGAALITDIAFIGTDLVGYYFNQATGKDGSLLQDLQTENAVSLGSSFAGKLGSNDITGIAHQIIKNLEHPCPPAGVQAENCSNVVNPVFNAQNMVRITVALFAYPVGQAIGQGAAEIVGAVVPALKTARIISSLPVDKAKVFEAFGGPTIGLLFATFAYTFPSESLGVALYLVALFAILYAVFRLLLALINNYLTIILLTITAPFQFLAASIPGRQEIAINWARNMLCNVLSFPAVIAVFYFAAYLIGENKIKAFDLTNPLVITSTSTTLPLFGGMDLSFMRLLLAFGAILVTPKIPELICRTIGKPGASGQLFDQAINQSLGEGQKYISQNQQSIGKFAQHAKERYEKWHGPDWYRSIGDEANFDRWMEGKEPFGGALRRKLPVDRARLQRIQEHVNRLSKDEKAKELNRILTDMHSPYPHVSMTPSTYADFIRGVDPDDEIVKGLTGLNKDYHREMMNPKKDTANTADSTIQASPPVGAIKP